MNILEEIDKDLIEEDDVLLKFELTYAYEDLLYVIPTITYTTTSELYEAETFNEEVKKSKSLNNSRKSSKRVYDKPPQELCQYIPDTIKEQSKVNLLNNTSLSPQVKDSSNSALDQNNFSNAHPTVINTNEEHKEIPSNLNGTWEMTTQKFSIKNTLDANRFSSIQKHRTNRMKTNNASKVLPSINKMMPLKIRRLLNAMQHNYKLGNKPLRNQSSVNCELCSTTLPQDWISNTSIRKDVRILVGEPVRRLLTVYKDENASLKLHTNAVKVDQREKIIKAKLSSMRSKSNKIRLNINKLNPKRTMYKRKDEINIDPAITFRCDSKGIIQEAKHLSCAKKVRNLKFNTTSHNASAKKKRHLIKTITFIHTQEHKINEKDLYKDDIDWIDVDWGKSKLFEQISKQRNDIWSKFSGKKLLSEFDIMAAFISDNKQINNKAEATLIALCNNIGIHMSDVVI